MPLTLDDSIDNVVNNPGTTLAVSASSTSSVYVTGTVIVCGSVPSVGTAGMFASLPVGGIDANNAKSNPMTVVTQSTNISTSETLLMVGGKDGTNRVYSIPVSVGGGGVIISTAGGGVSVTGTTLTGNQHTTNPVIVGGVDTLNNARTIQTTTAGVVVVTASATGPVYVALTGALASHPVTQGGAWNALVSGTIGATQSGAFSIAVSGGVASGSAANANPVMVGGVDSGGIVRTMLVLTASSAGVSAGPGGLILPGVQYAHDSTVWPFPIRSNGTSVGSDHHHSVGGKDLLGAYRTLAVTTGGVAFVTSTQALPVWVTGTVTTAGGGGGAVTQGGAWSTLVSGADLTGTVNQAVRPVVVGGHAHNDSIRSLPVFLLNSTTAQASQSLVPVGTYDYTNGVIRGLPVGTADSTTHTVGVIVAGIDSTSGSHIIRTDKIGTTIVTSSAASPVWATGTIHVDNPTGSIKTTAAVAGDAAIVVAVSPINAVTVTSSVSSPAYVQFTGALPVAAHQVQQGSSWQCNVSGNVSTGSIAPGAPVVVGGADSGNVLRTIQTDGNGRIINASVASIPVYVAVTGSVPVEVIATSATGAATPVQTMYIGGNNAGTFRGVTVDGAGVLQVTSAFASPLHITSSLAAPLWMRVTASMPVSATNTAAAVKTTAPAAGDSSVVVTVSPIFPVGVSSSVGVPLWVTSSFSSPVHITSSAATPAWVRPVGIDFSGNLRQPAVDFTGNMRIANSFVSTYAAAIPSGTTALTVTPTLTANTTASLVALYHPAASAKRIEILRINVSAMSGAIGSTIPYSIRLGKYAIVPTGGTAVTGTVVDGNDTATPDLQITASYTNTPTTGYAMAVMGAMAQSSASVNFDIWNAHLNGKPLVLRPGIAEAYYIYVLNGPAAFSISPVFNIGVEWTER